MKRLLVLFALLVVACGSDGADDGEAIATLESTTTTESVQPVDAETGGLENDTEAAFLAFTSCLRAEGIDVPDPTVDSEGNPQFTQPPDLSDITPDELNAALDACRDELEQVTLGFIGTDLTGLEDTLLEYAVCMRENGFDLPDPDLSFDLTGGDGFQGPFGDVDFNDPDFIAADEQCASIVESLGTRP